MFIGTFAPKLDDKGRLILPAKFRDAFAGGVVMTKGQERCVELQTVAQLEAKAARLREASMTNPEVRGYVRMLFTGGHEQVPDKQGRVGVPTNLREYAALDRELVVLGVMDHVEMWNPQTWESYSAEQEPKFADLAHEIFPGI